MRAVIYARYSSDKQNASFSIEEQLDACSRKALQENHTIVEIFKDLAQSAKTTNRPALTDMLAYATNKQNDIDSLYIYDISRLSRDQIDFAIIKRDLSKHGITVRSVQGIPNDTLEGDLTQDLLARVSQYKNEIDTIKIKGGLYKRFKSGLAPRLVRGYKWALNSEGRKTLVPDETFPIIQALWHKVAKEKLTIKQAVKYINSIIPSPAFQLDSMSRLLSNKTYCGILVYPTYVGEEVKGVHEPMIDEETFYLVRQIITGRSHKNVKTRNKVNPAYPLTKVLLCPSCDARLTAARSKGKNDYFEYYFCRKRGKCKYNMQVGKVHDAFILKLSEIRPSKELMQYIKEMIREKYESRFNDLTLSTKIIEAELQKLLTQKQTLLDKLLDGVIVDEDFKAGKRRLDAEIISRQTLISEKKLDRIDIETVLNFLEYYMQNIHKLWGNFSIEAKIALQSSTFPKGVYFENGACRTPFLNPAFEAKHEEEQQTNHDLCTDSPLCRTPQLDYEAYFKLYQEMSPYLQLIP